MNKTPREEDNAHMDPLQSFEIDYNSGLPVWIQLKNRISYLIGAGEYKEGHKLPTVRALAVALDISYNTVNRSYMDLEREGYITTRKGRGTFVAARSEGGEEEAGEGAIELLIDDMIRACTEVGMDDENILTQVQERLTRRKSGR